MCQGETRSSQVAIGDDDDDGEGGDIGAGG